MFAHSFVVSSSTASSLVPAKQPSLKRSRARLAGMQRMSKSAVWKAQSGSAHREGSAKGVACTR
eukprot:6191619-Pleurochrysis_carterae.AAC.1